MYRPRPPAGRKKGHTKSSCASNSSFSTCPQADSDLTLRHSFLEWNRPSGLWRCDNDHDHPSFQLTDRSLPNRSSTICGTKQTAATCQRQLFLLELDVDAAAGFSFAPPTFSCDPFLIKLHLTALVQATSSSRRLARLLRTLPRSLLLAEQLNLRTQC